ncbi:MAG TPA: hypothetical protein VNQ52_00455 [Microbacteriaceae bacterium]|nr:hypothetical protein [Microbacteriaceae bacterium]
MVGGDGGGTPTPRRGLPGPNEASRPVPSVAEAAPVAEASPLSIRRGLGSTPAPSPAVTPVGASSAPPAAPAETPSARRTRLRWRVPVLVGAAVIVLGIAAVLTAQWLRQLDWVDSFLLRYPGESRLPDNAPVGIPAWLGWQHFLNAFFLVLIVRSGLRVRGEPRPAVSWSPRWNPNRRISIWLWFHQSLDLLWLLNGVVYVVLLFVTGHWVRVVPTGWDVVPNAISAALQYVSLQWPTENGWVNYNSLQLLAYCFTVFVAAPLAIASGLRMSGLWPAKIGWLSRLVPIEAARRVHFPIMLYFVAFTTVHVLLVLSTGALRNLNHMYASIDAVNGIGLAVFVASVAVTVAAWVLARPLLLAGMARAFGTVSGR